jgi:hypothetical protein
MPSDAAQSAVAANLESLFIGSPRVVSVRPEPFDPAVRSERSASEVEEANGYAQDEPRDSEVEG